MNDWKDYPVTGKTRNRPLFDTGNREGWEEIRDGAKFVGSKVAGAGKALGRGLKRLVKREKT